MRGNCLQTDWDELEEAEQLLQTGKEPSPEAAPTHTHGALESVGKPARELLTQQPGGNSTTCVPYGRRNWEESGQAATAETEGSRRYISSGCSVKWSP